MFMENIRVAQKLSKHQISVELGISRKLIRKVLEGEPPVGQRGLYDLYFLNDALKALAKYRNGVQFNRYHPGYYQVKEVRGRGTKALWAE
jgi:hypothetical protein